MFKSSIFPNSLKLTRVTPLHKKVGKDLNKNYRSVSILQTLSKKFEKVMFAHADISDFFDGDFSKEKWGFREGYSTQFENAKKMDKMFW